MADAPFNLMALLQAAQQPGMRGMGPGVGPIPAQNPTPGFRAPGAGGMPMPQMQQQPNPMAQVPGLGAALSRMQPGVPTVPGGLGNGGAQVPGGITGATAGGYSFPGAPVGQDPSAAMAQPGFMDFLTGKLRSLFGPTTA